MDVHEKSNRCQVLHFKQITENYKKYVNRIIKNQTSTTSNQEEWKSVLKALKRSAEKNLGYNHKEKTMSRPKHSALFVDSERYQRQKLHQRRIKNNY